MEKKDLVKLLDEVFVPIGFIRKGNNWTCNNSELQKKINLQKSNFSNSYFINYGFIIHSLSLTTTMHYEIRLAGVNKKEQERITQLLNLEIEINDLQRASELKIIILTKIKSRLQDIESLIDLKNELFNRQHLNDIPLVVKRYFNFE